MTGEEMVALSKKHTLFEWSVQSKIVIHEPPLCVIEPELREAFSIIDRGLELTDRAVV